MIKHIADFIDWVYDFGNNGAITAMFTVGVVLTFLAIVVALVSFAPLLGIVVGLGTLLGVPVIFYVVERSKEGDE